MNREEFQIMHSSLIEQYQFIEFHLEGIYAAISGRNFLKALEDVQMDSISRIIREIKEIEKDRNLSVFTEDEYEKMRLIIQRRNFWCHSCYTDLLFDAKTGGLKKREDVCEMLDDLYEAKQLENVLHNKVVALLQGNA